MLNKKLLLVLIFLLFILQISFVTAQNNNTITNETTITQDYPELNTNNPPQKNTSENNNNNIIEYKQGDKIPIHINTFIDGNLKILIDNEEYKTYNFTQNETIYVPTYNAESFYNSSIKNIDIGLHNISLIFNFDYPCEHTTDISIDKNSTLNFQFHPKIFQPGSAYTYNITINILKKEKTIHIVNLVYYNLCECDGEYKIHIDNLEKDSLDAYGLIISNKDEIFYKQTFSSSCVDKLINSGLSYLYDIGSYNFTVINLADGTSDNKIFKTTQYQTKLNITHIIDETSITVFINNQYPYFREYGFITVDNMTKEILIDYYNRTVFDITFENLTLGTHSLTVYFPDYIESKEFIYNTTFEIEYPPFNPSEENQNNTEQNNSITNTANTTQIIGNANTTGNVTNLFKGNGGNQKNTNTKSKTKQKNTKKELTTPTIGKNNINQPNKNTLTQKAYEISQKSPTKIINNPLTQISIILIVFILLMIGYFEFRKKQ